MFDSLFSKPKQNLDAATLQLIAVLSTITMLYAYSGPIMRSFHGLAGANPARFGFSPSVQNQSRASWNPNVAAMQFGELPFNTHDEMYQPYTGHPYTGIGGEVVNTDYMDRADIEGVAKARRGAEKRAKLRESWSRGRERQMRQSRKLAEIKRYKSGYPRFDKLTGPGQKVHSKFTENEAYLNKRKWMGLTRKNILSGHYHGDPYVVVKDSEAAEKLRLLP